MVQVRLSAPKRPLDTAPSDRQSRKQARRGFTLIELVIAMVILAMLGAIGIPLYANYLEKAKIAKAIADIQAMESELGFYELSSGDLPDTLAEIGRGNFLVPWGNPYQYLKIAGGGNQEQGEAGQGGQGGETAKAGRGWKRRGRTSFWFR